MSNATVWASCLRLSQTSASSTWSSKRTTRVWNASGFSTRSLPTLTSSCLRTSSSALRRSRRRATRTWRRPA
uniref:Uncharacterized protein n=1 Tax=Ixodes ricinus TaxID=34613 RepID=A0A6B0UA23_IXORI